MNRLNLLVKLDRIAFQYNSEIEYSLHPGVVVESVNKVRTNCKALKFKNEAPGMCCLNGKVKLPPLKAPLEPLFSLVAGTTTQSNDIPVWVPPLRKVESVYPWMKRSSPAVDPPPPPCALNSPADVGMLGNCPGKDERNYSSFPPANRTASGRTPQHAQQPRQKREVNTLAFASDLLFVIKNKLTPLRSFVSFQKHGSVCG
ncbi:hypothetical protein AVEN_250946-1 [Araneus ventricosus]|uniref:Uncharacterized protein n=1 Tax=Araneus ventricosus TaxID=182803 RepID=A0A4Y2PUL0_ARAVE|nr:hypothetical protein AVEN_250946-1 [Araneus ventricosus]